MRKEEAFKNEFLKGAELHGPAGAIKYPRPVTITIDEVIDGKTPDNKSQRVMVFDLEGEQRKLGLNKDRWESLESITGSQDDEDFAGVTVELYPIANVRTPQGGKTTGIGIRPAENGKAASKTTKKPAPSDDGPPSDDESGPPADDAAPSDPLESVKDKASAWKAAQDDAKARNVDQVTLTAKWREAVLAVGKNEKAFTADDWRNVAEKLIEVPF